VAAVNWQSALLVALGGAIGSVARWAAVFLVGQQVGLTYPWGTLSVNLVGSFLIGLIAALARAASLGVTPDVRLFLVTGVLGGFTTFSSFSLESLGLLQRGPIGPALAYVLGSVALGLTAAWLGFAFARLLPGGA
jgi:fluoride exporter